MQSSPTISKYWNRINYKGGRATNHDSQYFLATGTIPTGKLTRVGIPYDGGCYQFSSI